MREKKEKNFGKFSNPTNCLPFPLIPERISFRRRQDSNPSSEIGCSGPAIAFQGRSLFSHDR
jgi:hypothetical protein